MKLITRSILVLATAAGLIAPATAASAAEPIESRGRNCEGLRAYRCAWFNYDPNNNVLRGYGSVKNTTGFTVSLKVNVYLEGLSGSRWLQIASGTASDPSAEGGVTVVGRAPFPGSLPTCVHGRYYRSRVVWFWNTETGTVYSGAVKAC